MVFYIGLFFFFFEKLYLHAGNRETLQLHFNQTFSTCVPVDRMLYASCLGCNYVLLGLCERLKHYQHCTNHHTLQLLPLFRNSVFYDTRFQSPTQLQIMEFSPDTVGRRGIDGIVTAGQKKRWRTLNMWMRNIHVTYVNGKCRELLMRNGMTGRWDGSKSSCNLQINVHAHLHTLTCMHMLSCRILMVGY